jgi:vitamin B12 transporter
MQKNLLVVLLASASLSSQAETPLEEILVTATRTQEKAEESLASVTLIERADIERQQAQSLPDLLSRVPGIHLTNQGGPGKLTSLFMRGTNSDHTLILIDGVKAGSATTGMSSIQYLPLEQIERIEIVRGPRSALYGSEAIGGVIQIFTRKGVTGFQPYLHLQAGSHGTTKGAMGFSGGSGAAWMNLHLDHESTDGIDACSNDSFTCGGSEPDDDRYENLSLGLNVGYHFSQRADIAFHVQQSRGDVDNDSTWTNEADYLIQTLGGTAHFSPMTPWTITISAGQHLDESDNYLNGTFMNRTHTKRETWSVQNDLALTDEHLLTLGFDHQLDGVTATTAYTESRRSNQGIFAQYQGQFGDHDLQLSLRQDDNEQFGTHETGGVAWGYGITEDIKVYASYGTAFAAPTFNDLYFPFGFGNPNLEPEESKSYEIGIKGQQSFGHWQLSLFQTDIDHLITYDPLAFTMTNVDQARIQGLEASLNTNIHGWMIDTSLTLQDPENRSAGANHGNQLARRAKSKVVIAVDKAFSDYAIGATLTAVGDSYDDPANTTKLDAYSKVDLRGSYELTRDWRLEASVDNLLDEDYQTANDFHQLGRSFYLGVRYNPR